MNSNQRKLFSRGFTAMELLVVLSIAGVLMAIVFASFSDARANARDKERIADLANLKLAFKIYEEQYGKLPTCPVYLYLNPSGFADTKTWSSGCSDVTNIETFLTSYFGTIPRDPLDDDDNTDSPNYVYVYDGQHDGCGDSTTNLLPPIVAVRELEKLSPPESVADVCDGDTSLGGNADLSSAANPYLLRLDR